MKIEEVYFIDKNNAPQPRTIVENRTFDHNGYRITHFSMGANTAGSPERYRHLGIYSCNVGCVHLEVHHSNAPTETITLHKGEFWLRPCNTLLGWYVEEDTIFTVINLRFTANLIQDAKIGGVCSVNHIPDAPENECIVKRVIDDDLMKIDFVQLGKNGRYEIPEERNIIFAVEKGSCSIQYRDKQLKIEDNQSFHSFHSTKKVITSEVGCNIIMLTVFELH